MGHYHPDIILVSQTYTVVNTNLDDGVSNNQDEAVRRLFSQTNVICVNKFSKLRTHSPGCVPVHRRTRPDQLRNASTSCRNLQ